MGLKTNFEAGRVQHAGSNLSRHTRTSLDPERAGCLCSPEELSEAA